MKISKWEYECVIKGCGQVSRKRPCWLSLKSDVKPDRPDMCPFGGKAIWKLQGVPGEKEK